MTDAELLEEYRARNDGQAFRVLMTRHAGLVYHTALRHTGDPETARDVSQMVFSLLARKASRLRGGEGLAGWLHRAAVFQARNEARAEGRHRRVLALDAVPADAGPPGADPGDALRLSLDDALERLPERDRELLLAHYYLGRTWQEIATLRGESGMAVQRRASRAVEKLGAILRRRGITVPAALLAAGLTRVLREEALANPASVPAAPTLVPSPPAFPWMGSLAARAAVLLMAAGLSGTLAFAAARRDEPEGAPRSSSRISRSPQGAGSLHGPAALAVRPHPGGDWRGTLEEAAAILRSGEDRHATARAAWMLASLRKEELAPAFAAASALSPDDKCRDYLAGILLCLWAPLDSAASWAACATYSPGASAIREDFPDFAAAFFLKRWEISPAACVASLSTANGDFRQFLAYHAYHKLRSTPSGQARWRETVAATSDDEARAQGARLAIQALRPEEGAENLAWFFSLQYNDPARRERTLRGFLEEVANDEFLGITLSGWLENQPGEQAAAVLGDLQRVSLAADEETRAALSRKLTHPGLLKAIRQSL